MAEAIYRDRMSDMDALLWNTERDPMLRSTIVSLLVLDQPPMQLFFLGLGDSSLNFELRVYVFDARYAGHISSIEAFSLVAGIVGGELVGLLRTNGILVADTITFGFTTVFGTLAWLLVHFLSAALFATLIVGIGVFMGWVSEQLDKKNK